MANWRKSTVTTVTYRLYETPFTCIVVDDPERAIRWRVNHDGGMWNEEGTAETVEAAKAAAEAAMPAIAKERDEYYARVNPKLYGKKEGQ